MTGETCAVCDEGFVPGDTAVPVTIVLELEEPPRQGHQHVECVALITVGHDIGVCGCTGWTTSRVAAREVMSRLRALAGRPVI